MTTPRDRTLEIEPHPDRCERCRQAHHGAGRVCSWCGSTDRYPAKQVRRRIIGGKRGRNSGTVGTAKSKT